MPTPQDDLFLGPALKPLWVFSDTPDSGTPPGYSFTENVGNITIDVTALMLLMQSVIWTDYYVEVGITESNAISLSRFGGLRIQSATAGTYIEFAQYFDSVSELPRLRATSYVGGSPTTIADIAYEQSSNIILRILKHDGMFSFLYKSESSVEFSQMPSTFGVTAAYSAAPGNLVGIEAGGNNAPNYSLIASHFYFREVSDIIVNADITLAVTRRIVTNAEILIGVQVFTPPQNFTVSQYADQRLVQIDWSSPVLEFTKLTLKSPGGFVYDLLISDGGIFETETSVLEPVENPIIQGANGSFYEISVSDSGTFATSPAPDATFSDSALIFMGSTPSNDLYQLLVSALGALLPVAGSFTYLGTTLVRNSNRYPTSPTDGTVLLSNSLLTSYLDGPLAGLSRFYYAAFAIYSIFTPKPSTDATMPVFDNLYKNTGRKRFSRVYQSGPWAMVYACARLIQTLVDVDIPAAMAQFNLQTSTGYFANLWGKIFGSRRYPGESDKSYTSRILSRVTLPRTTSDTIIQQVLAVPGVFYCDIQDAIEFPSMIVGYSFIGFAGATGYESYSDEIVFAPSDNPFYFTVRVKLLANTNLALILQAIDDNKQGGCRYSVLVLETI